MLTGYLCMGSRELVTVIFFNTKSIRIFGERTSLDSFQHDMDNIHNITLTG